MSRWELWLLLGLAVLCLALAVAGRGRRERQRYQDFMERAPRIEKALHAFAADHGGRFPPDARFTNPPPGLHPDYLEWEAGWLIDYDAHPNGKGGYYVCLEFCGPTGERHYYGLCNQPRLRRRFGRGQPIPGHANRIWVVAEEAPVLEGPGQDPGGAG